MIRPEGEMPHLKMKASRLLMQTARFVYGTDRGRTDHSPAVGPAEDSPSAGALCRAAWYCEGVHPNISRK